MRKQLPVIFAYLALLILSLPIPLLHQHFTDRAIESMRPVMKLSDGSFDGLLMPWTFFCSAGSDNFLGLWFVESSFVSRFRSEEKSLHDLLRFVLWQFVSALLRHCMRFMQHFCLGSRGYIVRPNL